MTSVTTLSNFSNGLSKAEAERLALLMEEAGEVIQMIGKILRHGYESSHPDYGSQTNRQMLERELGDMVTATNLMFTAKDLDPVSVEACAASKAIRVQKFLHHQG